MRRDAPLYRDISMVIGLFFAYCGFLRLLQPVESLEIRLQLLGVLGGPVLGPVSRALSWVEYIGGAYLLLGFLQQTAACSLLFTSFFYETILGQAYMRNLIFPFQENRLLTGVFSQLTLSQALCLEAVLVICLARLTLFPAITSEASNHSARNASTGESRAALDAG